MNNKVRVILLAVVAVLLLSVPALAADSFAFTEKKATVFEGEDYVLSLKRDGAALDDGELSFTVSNPKVAEVSDDGVVTGLSKGSCNITATLQTARKRFRASIAVQVQRPVKKVTLNTSSLNVYYPDDARVAELLRSDTADEVIVLPVKKSKNLSATCTPSDASSVKVTYTSSDEGVAKISGNNLVGRQAGECDLTVSSVLNPEVSVTYHILVVQPVTKITVAGEDGRKSVAMGGELQLVAECAPADASIQDVIWSSNTPGNATVDEFGVVTGVKKGNVVIEAKAADGSGAAAKIQLTVTQPVDNVVMKQSSIDIIAGSSNAKQVSATVEPNTANDKSVTWTSTDESIATVNAKTGMVTGVSAGSCMLIAASNSNPDVTAVMTVNVIQRVQEIRFDRSSATIRKGDSISLNWDIYPADASVKTVRLVSANPKIATVDDYGTVTGISRGTVNITATATDGSNRKGTVKIDVTQPVEGVSMQNRRYYIQIKKNNTVRATVEPKNANNINCNFWAEDDRMVDVQNTNSNNACNVKGLREGTTTLYVETEDGGYTAQAELRVADFNGAVQIEDCWIENNRIKIVLRNESNFTVEKVYFRVECFDDNGEPVICNRDGISTFFNGTYPIEMYPDESSVHGKFNFVECVYPEYLGAIRVRITGWEDSEGYTRRASDESLWPSADYNKTMHHGF